MGSVKFTFVLTAVLMLAATAAAEDGALALAVLDAPLPSIDTPSGEAPQMDPREVEEMRSAIRRDLARRRRINLARFREYVGREVYPVNSYQPGYMNVFIDEEGHICAAATIMTMDGFGELVQRQAVEDNFVRLGEVRDGALYEWILASGFTQEEIATIQEPFFVPALEPEPVFSPEQLREQEKIRLRARYGEILSELRQGRDASLDLATDRLLAHRLAAF
jgi:hypothetical protein